MCWSLCWCFMHVIQSTLHPYWLDFMPILQMEKPRFKMTKPDSEHWDADQGPSGFPKHSSLHHRHVPKTAQTDHLSKSQIECYWNSGTSDAQILTIMYPKYGRPIQSETGRLLRSHCQTTWANVLLDNDSVPLHWVHETRSLYLNRPITSACSVLW